MTAASSYWRSDAGGPSALFWSVDLSCRSGCLVVAPGSATPSRVFWAAVLLPLLRTFDGPVVLDLTRGKVNTSTVAELVTSGGPAGLIRRPPGELRVVAAPSDLSRAHRALDRAAIRVYQTLQDAIGPQKSGPPYGPYKDTL